jgi:hypothetical protein
MVKRLVEDEEMFQRTCRTLVVSFRFDGKGVTRSTTMVKLVVLGVVCCFFFPLFSQFFTPSLHEVTIECLTLLQLP